MKKDRSFTRLKIILVFFLAGFFAVQAYKLYWPKATVILKDQPLRVLVANNTYRHYKGLGGRDSIAPYHGMLFIFSTPGRYAFVMRDMEFSIDIVWLLDGAVVDIAPGVPLEPGVKKDDLRRYIPRKPATMVLELPAGWAVEHELKIGDRLSVGKE